MKSQRTKFKEYELFTIAVKIHVNESNIYIAKVIIPAKFTKDYIHNVKTRKPKHYGSLAENLPHFPWKSKGMILPLRFRGKDRPECNLTWIKQPEWN